MSDREFKDQFDSFFFDSVKVNETKLWIVSLPISKTSFFSWQVGVPLTFLTVRGCRIFN